jgi:hypothetical protein
VIRRRKRDGNRIYFTEETQQAIVKYNKTTDPDEREHLYREYIEYPLDKLAENIINRFKFPYVNHSFDDIKKQVVSFLVINLSKYSDGKGKAFSYFSVIAKNYLILHNNNGYKQERRDVGLSDAVGNSIPLEETHELVHPTVEHQEDVKEFIVLMVDYWDANVHKMFKKKRDLDIANAVVELFRRVDNIENFNKKALYLMVREMANCKTSSITKVVNKMKEAVQYQLIEYNERGIISEESSKFFTHK